MGKSTSDDISTAFSGHPHYTVYRERYDDGEVHAVVVVVLVVKRRRIILVPVNNL